MGLLLGSLFCSVYVSAYLPVVLFALHCNMFCITTLYGSFVIRFEIRKCVTSSFGWRLLRVFLCFICFICFRTFFFFCKKNATEILIEIVFSLKITYTSMDYYK